MLLRKLVLLLGNDVACLLLPETMRDLTTCAVVLPSHHIPCATVDCTLYTCPLAAVTAAAAAVL